MAVNNLPIFPKTPTFACGVVLTAANTARDGTGTTSVPITAGTDGAYFLGLELMPLGTNVATLLTVFQNNGATSATASNNTLIGELTLPATALNNAVGQPKRSLYFDRPIPAGHKILVALTTAVAAGWAVAPIVQDLS